jgi:hypothetical protein
MIVKQLQRLALRDFLNVGYENPDQRLALVRSRLQPPSPQTAGNPATWAKMCGLKPSAQTA